MDIASGLNLVADNPILGCHLGQDMLEQKDKPLMKVEIDDDRVVLKCFIPKPVLIYFCHVAFVAHAVFFYIIGQGRPSCSIQ